MSVEFEENNGIPRVAYAPDESPSRLAQIVIRTGIVKNENQANYVLGGLAFAVCILAFFIFSHIGSSARPRVSQETINRALQATIDQQAQ